MNTYQYLIAMLCLCVSNTYGQKVIQTQFTKDILIIDGSLDESAWQNQIQVATDFISVSPVPNQTPAVQSFVKILYNHESLFVGAFLEEVSSDSIMQELVQRDGIGNTDFFGIILDTYGNGSNAFEFILSSTGVQFDAKVIPNYEDNSWDAVWMGATQITDNGWYAELEIPFSAIRFPKDSVQDWNLNLIRRRSVSGEAYWWNNVDFEQSNPILTQMGQLEGIRGIKSPIRLSLSPYGTIYGLHSKDLNRNPETSLGSSYNFGLDLKYGINDAFTLDMTLVPDFGQVRSDNEVLNLSPFEVRYNENRSFFTEGLELFDKAGIFYSRRVGDNQQLYNATKISGRTNNGLGIGFFNAVAKEESHWIEDIESGDDIKVVSKPLANYNVFVFDQDLKNNSFVTLTNTNVFRRGEEFKNANVTAGTFDLKNKSQTYGVNGQIALSRINQKQESPVMGHHVLINTAKINGSLLMNLNYEERSKDYTHNDLGFQTINNYRSLLLNMTKRDLDGFWKFNRFNYWGGIRYFENIEPRKRAVTEMNIGMFAEMKSFFRFNIWGGHGLAANDFYETRTTDQYFQKPPVWYIGYWWGTDNRKKLRFQSYGNTYIYQAQSDWVTRQIGGYISYRFSDKFNMNFDSYLQTKSNDQGYVNTEDNEIIFGTRNVRTISSVLNINYTLNNKMGITFSGRHYWSRVSYNNFYDLQSNGSLLRSDYEQFHDLTFDAFTIDAVYRWRFAPGSDISIVWKRNISGVHQNTITDYSRYTYFEGVRELDRLPQNNSLSLRVTYFLDYAMNIQSKFQRNK